MAFEGGHFHFEILSPLFLDRYSEKKNTTIPSKSLSYLPRSLRSTTSLSVQKQKTPRNEHDLYEFTLATIGFAN